MTLNTEFEQVVPLFAREESKRTCSWPAFLSKKIYALVERVPAPGRLALLAHACRAGVGVGVVEVHCDESVRDVCYDLCVVSSAYVRRQEVSTNF